MKNTNTQTTIYTNTQIRIHTKSRSAASSKLPMPFAKKTTKGEGNEQMEHRNDGEGRWFEGLWGRLFYRNVTPWVVSPPPPPRIWLPWRGGEGAEKVVQDPPAPFGEEAQVPPPPTPLLPIHARGPVIQGAAWAPGCRRAGGLGPSRRSLSIQPVPRNGVLNLILCNQISRHAMSEICVLQFILFLQRLSR